MWTWTEKYWITYLKVAAQSFVPKCDLGSTISGNGFRTFEKAHHFLNLFFDFIQQNPKSRPSLFSCKKLAFLIIYLVATLKFGKKEKLGKFIKVSILFVRGCNFTRCRLNNNIPCNNICLWTNFPNYFLAFLVPSRKSLELIGRSLWKSFLQIKAS